jgi:putative sigma-54 modulation protein
MEVRIQSIHFNASAALVNFIQKKVSKLEQFYDEILEVEVILKVIKPETTLNKDALVKIKASGAELLASKSSDTFEESVDMAVDALEKQLIKFKEKNRTK